METCYRVDIGNCTIMETDVWDEAWRTYREIDAYSDDDLIGRTKMLWSREEGLVAVDLIRKPLLVEEYAYRLSLLSVDEYKAYQDCIVPLQRLMFSAKSQEEADETDVKHKEVISWVLWLTDERCRKKVEALKKWLDISGDE